MAKAAHYSVDLRVGQWSCPWCHKTGYATRKLAKQAMRVIHPTDKTMSVYRCRCAPEDSDSLWHFGHGRGDGA